MRSAYLETADQTSHSDYQLIVIGRRSVRATPTTVWDDIFDTPTKQLKMHLKPFCTPFPGNMSFNLLV